MIVVLYLGGACGDMVSAVIDSTNCNMLGTKMDTTKERQRFKKFSLFANDKEADDVYHQLADQYLSIPSHYTDYHLSRNHDIIAITISNRDDAMWAATRIKEVHPLATWEQMMRFTNVKTIEEYAQSMLYWSNDIRLKVAKTIDLSDIRSGNLI